MQDKFREELIRTGYVHAPLPLHQEKSLEAECARKKVFDQRVIWNGLEDLPVHSGIGTMEERKGGGRVGGSTIRVTAPTQRNTMPYDDGATAHI